ncbi:FMN-dependent NADH-azoreductase [Marinicella rhabdoformis]|uniref:FMN-dependent NADH-azoreductase n=1 Tax=Marinicella rhabdoformis TaxID=2580566 RepID=UPI0012AEB3AA|nr:NAD(P)H-dependent oxidoreductase [Marinicella rhabdoformis]
MTQHILQLDSSGQHEHSVTQKVTAQVTEAIKVYGQEKQIPSNTVRRDLTNNTPLIDGEWMQANFTPAEQKTPDQIETLAFSDHLIAELNQANHLVIGVPIYNFNIPVALKAWIDLIARAKVTFRYTENGPEGLVTPKKVYLVYASGGTPMGSAIDFATPYLKHVLSFIGLDDVTLIDSKDFDLDTFKQSLLA